LDTPFSLLWTFLCLRLQFKKKEKKQIDMAKATRRPPLGVGLSNLLKEVDNQKEKEAAILKTENVFLKEQLKDCREQLAYMQKIFAMKMK